MEVFEGQSILNFIKELPNDEACKAYLAKIKWQDGFTCVKCGHSKGCAKAGYLPLLRLSSCRECYC